jgi:hypothetical protein
VSLLHDATNLGKTLFGKKKFVVSDNVTVNSSVIFDKLRDTLFNDRKSVVGTNPFNLVAEKLGELNRTASS